MRKWVVKVSGEKVVLKSVNTEFAMRNETMGHWILRGT